MCGDPTFYEDAFRAFSKPSFNVSKMFKVSFIGEPATVDDGGPQREFFSLLIHGISKCRVYLVVGQSTLFLFMMSQGHRKQQVLCCWQYACYMPGSRRRTTSLLRKTCCWLHYIWCHSKWNLCRWHSRFWSQATSIEGIIKLLVCSFNPMPILHFHNFVKFSFLILDRRGNFRVCKRGVLGQGSPWMKLANHILCMFACCSWKIPVPMRSSWMKSRKRSVIFDSVVAMQRQHHQ